MPDVAVKPRCVAVKANGERCRNTILPKGSDLCMAHGRPEVLARSREDARLRVLSEREMRRPPEKFYAEGWDSRPFRPAGECASRFGVDSSTVTRWYAWVRHHEAQGALVWVGPARGFGGSVWDLTEGDIPALVEDFVGFRPRFFRDPRGAEYVTPGFQRRWLETVLVALVTGGRQVILSPPRHGKTELLIHFSVWLVCRFPNVRILWIGGNERIAQRSVGSVAQHLSSNADLIEEFCGPGGSFRPGPKEGLSWSKTEFTVATRTVTGMKGATMTALGRGGTLLSLDADIIVADDIEDHGSVAQPGSREGTREWWTSQLESRKEEHTGLFVIGSRQHPDDLSGHLLENDMYESIVETAHDEACDVPQTPDRFGDHEECMLFPELRSFRYLMSQKSAAETTGGVGIFEMVYLNRSSAAGMQVFTAEIVDPCKSASYTVSQIPTPIRPPGHQGDVGQIQLVAGLDPSGSGYQAAFLWAYQTDPVLHLWMVDIENNLGGGIARARQTIEAWHESYGHLGLAHWVIEENLYQGGIVDDEKIVKFRQRHGIQMESWKTYRNKHDPRIGVTALQPLFAAKQVTLPYRDGPSQEKTDAYRRQLIYWDGNAPRNRNTKAGYKSDLVMASWFPLDVIRRAQSDSHAEMGVQYPAAFGSFAASQWNTVPWGQRRSA